MLPDSPKVMLNPNNAQQPSWRVLNAFICGNGECQLDGEAMAPEYLYKDIGKKVRIINYREGMKGTSIIFFTFKSLSALILV